MNLYWPVYKRIEKEVVDLAYDIQFTDNQLSVYSVGIADLIVRCAIEIESISKDLYCRLGGDMNPKRNNGDKRDLYFDSDCLKLLNKKWHLDKKAIKIIGSNMDFKNQPELFPLKDADKKRNQGSEWKQAYQALKHSRYESLEQGNLSNLLGRLGRYLYLIFTMKMLTILRVC